MPRKTPMMHLFEYFDAMIHENIDWYELKKKALEMEANEMLYVHTMGMDEMKPRFKDFNDFYTQTYTNAEIKPNTPLH
jgi:hypothetical protein